MGLGDNAFNRTPHSNYLPSIKSNQELTPKFFGKIIQGIDNSTPRFGNGYQVANYAGGSVFRINQQPWSAGAAPTNFQVNAYIENGVSWASVSVGTVNRVVPKIAGKYMDTVLNGSPPLIQISGLTGYIVIEVTATANKPFPDELEVKYVANSMPQDTANKSYYLLAKITGVNKSKSNPEPSVDVQQFHLVGNLGCNRFKVGQATFYFQWYTV